MAMRDCFPILINNSDLGSLKGHLECIFSLFEILEFTVNIKGNDNDTGCQIEISNGLGQYVSFEILKNPTIDYDNFSIETEITSVASLIEWLATHINIHLSNRNFVVKPNILHGEIEFAPGQVIRI